MALPMLLNNPCLGFGGALGVDEERERPSHGFEALEPSEG